MAILIVQSAKYPMVMSIAILDPEDINWKLNSLFNNKLNESDWVWRIRTIY